MEHRRRMSKLLHYETLSFTCRYVIMNNKAIIVSVGLNSYYKFWFDQFFDIMTFKHQGYIEHQNTKTTENLKNKST